MIKWRDFIARVEDESVGYVMPNHVLFQICQDLPSTLNELRDSCRSNMTTILMKYQTDLIEFINERVQRALTKQVNTHVKFDQAQVMPKRKVSSSSSSEEENV